jgi:branched-chain amino acid transport system permease protein
MIAEDELAKTDPVYWFFWLGLLLVLVVMFARGGMIGLAEQGWRTLRRSRT